MMGKTASKEIKSAYNHYIRQKIIILIGLVALTLLTMLFSLSAGSADIPIGEIIKVLLGLEAQKSASIALNIRLPRVLMAVVGGIGLASAGCVMQGILKNPLASASTLGIAQGASFGAAIAITFLTPYLTSMAAFMAAMLVTLVILGLSTVRKAGPETMILAGVALSSLFAGATALIQYFSSDVETAAIIFWTFGDLGRATYGDIQTTLIVVGGVVIYFALNGWNYNALESGEDAALGLGVNVNKVRLIGMSVAALTAATIVSFVGIINFIGLIAPHIMRRFVGNDYRFLLPASALMGALLLLVSDAFSRLIIAPVILPIGAVTSFLGAPLFLYLIFKGVDKHVKN